MSAERFGPSPLLRVLPIHLQIRNLAEQLLKLNRVCTACLWPLPQCVCRRLP